MTSSLVGSEMCIRDSVQPGSTASEIHKTQYLPMTQALKKIGFVVAQGAVSYTHLTLPTICSV
eukprot:7481665-Prorocentrum_lima.AAC.1